MSKPPIEDMWRYIEKILLPYGEMPDKTKMNDDEVFKLYTVIKEADDLFRMLSQIATLKKTIDDMMKK